jgi:hypothetical protein
MADGSDALKRRGQPQRKPFGSPAGAPFARRSTVHRAENGIAFELRRRRTFKTGDNDDALPAAVGLQTLIGS